MAAWTHGPNDLADKVSGNELAVVFQEVIRAVQRRYICLAGAAPGFTPAVSYPCVVADIVDKEILWEEWTGPIDWLGHIAYYINWLLDMPGGLPREWTPAGGPGGGTKVTFRWIESDGTEWTKAALHTAAHGDPAFTLIPNQPKYCAIETRLREAMLCLELMDKVQFTVANDSPYAGVKTPLYWYNSVGQASINDAYAAMDTVTDDWTALPGYGTGWECPQFTCGHFAGILGAAGTYFYYIIGHGCWTLEEEFDSKMNSVWDYGDDSNPGHYVQCGLHEVDVNFDPFSIILYSDGNWQPTCTTADFPCTGGVAEDGETVPMGAAHKLVTMDIDDDSLPDGGDTYLDFRCSTDQKAWNTFPGQYEHLSFFPGDATIYDEYVRITYDLKAAYDPTG